MALTGLEIYKLLPKTNCKECGFPTCLAFAMKLAQKGTELDKCPYVTDETRAALDAASAPPVKLVTVGAGERAFSVGNETVLFRHEKTFFNQPGLGVRLADDDPDLAAHAAHRRRLRRRARRHAGCASTSSRSRTPRATPPPSPAAAAATAAAADVPLVLLCEDATAMGAALAEVAPARPLLHAATAANWQAMAALAKQHGCPLAIRADDGDLEALARLSEDVRGAGVEDLVLDPGTRRLGDSLAAFTQLRRLALKKSFRPFGFPLIAFAGGETVEDQTVLATQAIAKYAGLVVLDHGQAEGIYPLLSLRQNIYTDPQKPIQVEPGLYQIGAAGRRQPAAHHDELLAHLLQRLGRGRGRRQPGLAARGRRRRPVGAHELGRRQVRRREDRQDGQGVGRRRQADAQEAGHPRPRRLALGRDRGGAAGLADHGRTARGGRHPELPEDGLVTGVMVSLDT